MTALLIARVALAALAMLIVTSTNRPANWQEMAQYVALVAFAALMVLL